MNSMYKNGDPTLKDIFAGIDKIRHGEGNGALEPRAAGDGSSRTERTDMPDHALGTYGPRSDASQPGENLEQLARAAMVAAADAIIQPWLYKHLPRIIEERLSAILTERIERVTATLRQQTADEVDRRLDPALKQAEERISSALVQQISDALNHRLDPLVTRQVAAVEERLAIALSVRVADVVRQELEPTLRKHVAAVEDRIALTINDRVAEAVNRQLEPAATRHVAAAEQRIAATASRQVKDEISRRLRRIADE